MTPFTSRPINLALVLLLGASAALGATEEAAAPAPMFVRQGERLTVPANSPLRSRLVVAAVADKTSPHAIGIPGIVEADPTLVVNVLPPLAGRVVELPVNLGDPVQKGQLVARLSSGDMAQAVSDMEKARDSEKLAKQALERARGVNQAGANAVKDLEQAQSNYSQALSELNRSEARLKSLGISDDAGAATSALSIRAPVSGTVTSLSVGIGAFANDPTVALMTIANLDRVWVTASVPEDLVGVVAKGQHADVSFPAYPGELLHGTVSSISALLEPDTRRNKVRLVFANHDGRLKPNMYATVALQVPQSRQVVVPTSALLMNNDKTTVFVEVQAWTFERRVVELGQEDGETVRVRSGLASGDRIVVRGGILLND